MGRDGVLSVGDVEELELLQEGKENCVQLSIALES